MEDNKQNTNDKVAEPKVADTTPATEASTTPKEVSTNEVKVPESVVAAEKEVNSEEIKMYTNIPQADLKKLQNDAENVRKEVAKMLIGQSELVDLLLVSLFTGGHVLLEGVPGIAKTLAAKLLAKSIDTEFSRVQFTPDLMPADVIGAAVFNMKTSAFDFQKGPVFSNIVLIDEINRSPAKTQAALIEVMEEKQITVDGTTHKMDEPFFIVATQNPIEQEGTYQLPEAQLDRFAFRIRMDLPELAEEKLILERYQSDFSPSFDEIQKVLNPVDIKKIFNMVEKVYIKKEVLDYIAQIVVSTRNSYQIYMGASPRASLWLLKSSKAFAALQGRDFVTPDDVKFLAPYVLNHRIVLSHEKELEGAPSELVIKELIDTIEVPR
jgi:MoxR-like ATPase